MKEQEQDVIYKAFILKHTGDGWIITAKGENVNEMTYETVDQARAYTDMWIGCGGTPFGQRANVFEFERRVAEIRAMRSNAEL